MNMTNQLNAEAQATRAAIADLESRRDALAREVETLTPRYHAACGESGRPLPEAEDLFQRLSGATAQLGRVASELQDQRAKLVDLDRLASSPQRAEQAEKAVRKARADVAACESKIADATSAIARLRQLESDERAAAERARGRLANAALAGLPDDVRALVSHEPLDPNEPQPDPAGHEQRAMALDQAADTLEGKRAALEVDLGAAKTAEAAAVADLLAQRCYVSEIQHAQALAQYLPALASYRAAHEAAHGWVPSLPHYAQLADEGFDDRVREARESVHASQGEGLLRKLGRKVAQAAGL